MVRKVYVISIRLVAIAFNSGKGLADYTTFLTTLQPEVPSMKGNQGQETSWW